MKQAFQRRHLPSKTGLVSIVNGRVLIRPPVLTVSSTANLFCWPAIATDSFRDVFLSRSIRYGSFSIVGDSPCRTSIHSHSIINKPSKPAWLKDLAVIDMGLYRRVYRQKRRSFAGAGDGAICGASTFSTPSSIRRKHTEKSTAPHDSPKSPERALRLRQQCPQSCGGTVKT